jgi:hypothetical protein
VPGTETCPRRTRPAYDDGVPLASGTAVMNGVLLASAVVPVLVVIVLSWLFLRAGRRHDERERAAGRPPAQ